MADETKVEAQAVAEAPAKVAEAVAETVETIVEESAKAAKRTRAAAVRSAKLEEVAAKPAPRRAKGGGVSPHAAPPPRKATPPQDPQYRSQARQEGGARDPEKE